jgi:hypothetical protein
LSPHCTVKLVGELVAEKLTVTNWPVSAGLGVIEPMVTTGALPWLTTMLAVPLLPE